EFERLFLWIAFNVFVLGMLALDGGVFHRKAHTVSIKEASIWSVAWITLAMAFNLGIYFAWGQESNVFAILGLPALYFMLAGVMEMFAYLKVGLSVVLCFVGAKMILVDVYKIPIGASLPVIGGVLLLSILASWAFQPKKAGVQSHK